MLTISQNNYNRQMTFNGHGAKRFSQVMDRLYYSAYIKSPNFREIPNIIKVTTTLEGKEVSGIVTFNNFGHYVHLELPEEFAKLKSKFCKNIIDKYNQIVTKGKANRA